MRRHAILVGLILLAVSLVTAASLNRLLRSHPQELERKAAELDRERGIVPVSIPLSTIPIARHLTHMRLRPTDMRLRRHHHRLRKLLLHASHQPEDVICLPGPL